MRKKPNNKLFKIFFQGTVMQFQEETLQILEGYKFGRFKEFFQHADRLRPHFQPYPDGDCGCESTLKQFDRLDGRFKRVLEWTTSMEGSFPNIFAKGCLNFLPEFEQPYGESQRIFYKNAPPVLKQTALRLFKMQMDKQYIAPQEAEVVDIVHSTKTVLDEGFDYISKLLNE
jgi:hypothetical protein